MYLRSCCLVALLTATACGGSSTPSSSSPSPSPPSSGGVTINGREPLGWSQTADDLVGYSFSIYVDGNKRDAPDASCTAAGSGTFECRSSLPSMTNGVHMLEVSATVNRGGGAVEGPRSASLTVTVNASATTAGALQIGAAGNTPGQLPKSAAHALAADDSLRCGLAPWDRHRGLFWTSQDDLALATADGSRQSLVWRQADDDEWRLTSAARDGDFDSTHFVFLTVLRHATGEDWLRVARYREVEGTLGERAILLEHRLGFRPTGTSTLMDGDGLLVALLGPSAEKPVPHQFVTIISTAGAVARAAASQVEMDAPIAVARAPSGTLAILDSRQPTGGTLQVNGATRAVDVPAAPIALRNASVDGVQRLVVVGADGSIVALRDAEDALPLLSLRAATSLQDAVLLPDGTTLGCGVASEAITVVSGPWRVRNEK